MLRPSTLERVPTSEWGARIAGYRMERKSRSVAVLSDPTGASRTPKFGVVRLV
jgi:hypothetical protein